MRRKLVFATLSVGLHFVLLALLVRLVAEPPSVTVDRVLEVDLVAAPPPAPAVPRVIEEPPPIAATPAPALSAGSARRSRLAPPAPVGDREVPVGPFTEASDGPAPEEHPDPPQLTPGMFKLSYEVMSKSVQTPVEKKPEHDDVDGMLAQYVEDLKAAQSVQQGKYDPDLLAMRNAVEGEWHPDFDQIHGGPLQEAPGKLLKNWKSSAETYGKTGSPVVLPDDPYKPEGFKPDAGIIDVKDQLEKTDSFTKRVALGVTIHFDGKGGWQLTDIKPSGHPEFDQAALEALESTLEDSDVLPGQKMKTKWSMEADFIVVPPLPVAGFSFDLALQHFEAIYPLKKKVKYRMKLLAVYKPDGKVTDAKPGKKKDAKSEPEK